MNKTILGSALVGVVIGTVLLSQPKLVKHVGNGPLPFIGIHLKWDYTNSLANIIFVVYKKTNLIDSYKEFAKTYAKDYWTTNWGPSGFFGVQASNELTKLGSVY